MSLHGVYSRMHDGERWKPFRNQAQIVVSEACMTYSTRPMAGETKRTELPIQWHGDTAFSVDWSPVCRRWGKAATFRAHVEHGVRGLEEQAQHSWRYEGAAAQNMQDHRRSHQARTPKSRPVPLLDEDRGVAKGRSSLARSRWPHAQIEVAVAKRDLRKEQQREKREKRKEKREERWFGHRKTRW